MIQEVMLSAVPSEKKPSTAANVVKTNTFSVLMDKTADISSGGYKKSGDAQMAANVLEKAKQEENTSLSYQTATMFLCGMIPTQVNLPESAAANTEMTQVTDAAGALNGMALPQSEKTGQQIETTDLPGAEQLQQPGNQSVWIPEEPLTQIRAGTDLPDTPGSDNLKENRPFQHSSEAAKYVVTLQPDQENQLTEIGSDNSLDTLESQNEKSNNINQRTVAFDFKDSVMPQGIKNENAVFSKTSVSVSQIQTAEQPALMRTAVTAIPVYTVPEQTLSQDGQTFLENPALRFIQSGNILIQSPMQSVTADNQDSLQQAASFSIHSETQQAERKLTTDSTNISRINTQSLPLTEKGAANSQTQKQPDAGADGQSLLGSGLPMTQIHKAVEFAPTDQEVVFTNQKDDNADVSIVTPMPISLSGKLTVVPVSDASTQIHQSVANQVTNQILVQYKQNKPEFEMELYPNDLGKVSVKMSVQDQVLTVVISAENPKTQSLLMMNSEHIRSVLQNSVSRPVEVTEPQQNLWYQQNQGNGQSAQQQQQPQEQENKQAQWSAAADRKYSETNEDFFSMMQKLRIQTMPI